MRSVVWYFMMAEMHRRLLAAAHHGGRHAARRLVHVGVLDHARERLLQPLHLADRQVELLADAGVGRRVAQQRLGAGSRGRRQRDRPAGGQALHQHAPALADHLLAADHPVDRDEHVAAPDRTVREGGAARQVAAADLDAGMVRRHQRHGDAEVLAAAQQVLGVDEAHGEADQRRLRRQRDVALLPGGADADHLLALVPALRHVADVAHGGGIGAGGRPGQRKAGHLQALGEARQVVVLLLGRAVFLDQLAGPERVRHHDDGARCRASARRCAPAPATAPEARSRARRAPWR